MVRTSFTAHTSISAVMTDLLAQHAGHPGALLPVLHALQDRIGHIPSEAVAPVARALGLSQAEVHGVITYYTHFRRTPPGQAVVQICQAESCQACGAEALIQQAQALLGCGLHKTRADGAVTLEPVACLGLCAASPALALNGTPHARLTPEKLDALLTPLGPGRNRPPSGDEA